MTSMDTSKFETRVLSTKEFRASMTSPVELAGSFDTSTLNDSLIQMRVRAFGWETNRNGFAFKEKALLAEHEDAFGKQMPAWKSFEKQFVDRNHLVRDNGNSHSDQVIGFIESADLQEDGVYLNLILWKRTLDEDEIAQLRNDSVSVSMEVAYTKALVVIDGIEYPVADAPRHDPRSAVRTMADESILSFIGIAVLFDGRRPGFASADVVTVENAALEIASLDGQKSFVSTNTQLEEVMDQKEIADMQAKLATLEAEKVELAAANTALTAVVEEKQAAVDKISADLGETYDKLNAAYAELQIARVKAFDDLLTASIKLDGLSEDAKTFVINLFNQLDPSCPEAFSDLANNLKEAGAAVIAAPEPAIETAAAEGVVPVSAPTPETPAVVTTETTDTAAIELAAAVPEIPSMTELARGTATTPETQFGIRHL